ncbi:unnamed protein product [Tilletia controversa]|uniref:Charged multivesicular body protein 3 n=1 Tax=Tilletia caries TaxID=13290 RepID=A0ABN7IQ84_9BASI|nr:unnamed protein product [Tilletia caries]CAD6976152.1 unnamed protein product [Tilletia controversa]
MQSLSRMVFGPTQEERVKTVQSQLRSEQRHLDRELRQLDAASAKAKGEVKRLAKKGDVKSAKILAREIVRTNKQKERLTLSKARLGSIGMQLQHQMAMYKVTGSMQKSTEVMKLSNQLAGIMEEMMDDTLDSGVLGEDEEELEEEAQGEVDKVLYELTDGKLGAAQSTAPLADLDAVGVEPSTESARRERDEEEKREMDRMQAALDGLLRG